MVCIVCFDALVIIWFLQQDRHSCEVIKLFNYSVVTLAIFIGWKLLKIIYMAILMAEDKLRCNDMNIILCEMDTNKLSHNLSR